MITVGTGGWRASAKRMVLLAAGLVAIAGWRPLAGQTTVPASDLDAFMARVLDRRNDDWRALHDYILSEREQFELTGPSEQRLYGTRREFTWFVRDGYLIRSPVRLDGVAPDARARQDYENKWLRDEQGRETMQAEKDRKARDKAHRDAQAEIAGELASGDDSAALVRQGLEPRFISEAYFMRFKFDPGNYYLAGRETMEGRSVLRIEYYPTRLFTDEGETSDDEGSAPPNPQQEKPKQDKSTEDKSKRDNRDEEFERKFNKVALVTLWVDPAEHQIVKYTFENTDLNFLPGRWLLRVGDISASMSMGQYFKGVWLPRSIAVHASLTLANGIYDARYGRDFFDYRQGEVKARIRSYTPRED